MLCQSCNGAQVARTCQLCGAHLCEDCFKTHQCRMMAGEAGAKHPAPPAKKTVGKAPAEPSS